MSTRYLVIIDPETMKGTMGTPPHQGYKGSHDNVSISLKTLNVRSICRMDEGNNFLSRESHLSESKNLIRNI